MALLGKRTREESGNPIIKDKRDALNKLKEYEEELAQLLPRDVCEKVLPVIQNWNPKGNIFMFYTKNAHKLRNIEVNGELHLNTDYGIWLNDKLLEAAKTWNAVVGELSDHFNWKNKNTPSICI